MKELIIDFIDALIPLGIAVLLLACLQAFTKKDLKTEENAKLADRLKKAGYSCLSPACSSSLQIS